MPICQLFLVNFYLKIASFWRALHFKISVKYYETKKIGSNKEIWNKKNC